MSGDEGTVLRGSAQQLVQAGGSALRVDTYTVALDTGINVTRQTSQLAAYPSGIYSSIPGEHVNPSPIGGGTAGANAAAVIAVEKAAGQETLAQQDKSGNPGIPETGSLEWQDWVDRGII